MRMKNVDQHLISSIRVHGSELQSTEVSTQ